MWLVGTGHWSRLYNYFKAIVPVPVVLSRGPGSFNITLVPQTNPRFIYTWCKTQGVGTFLITVLIFIKRCWIHSFHKDTSYLITNAVWSVGMYDHRLFDTVEIQSLYNTTRLETASVQTLQLRWFWQFINVARPPLTLPVQITAVVRSSDEASHWSADGNIQHSSRITSAGLSAVR